MHVKKENAIAILDAAFESGCRKFEGALKGYGGCPMAKDELTGNMPTEVLIQWLEEKNVIHGVNLGSLNHALEVANTVFN
jgi:hydroxymethylglutaryl-CoA lyase